MYYSIKPGVIGRVACSGLCIGYTSESDLQCEAAEDSQDSQSGLAPAGNRQKPTASVCVQGVTESAKTFAGNELFLVFQLLPIIVCLSR